MPSPPILLEARNLNRRHPDGRRRLLADVSLEVRAATRLAVVGPSGSGKTLLLRALAVLDPWDDGEVLWKGEPVRREAVPRFRRAVVYLHQRPALAEETVEAALRRPLALAVHRRRRFDAVRIAKLLGQLHRDESFLEKRTADLSGGEIQIVSLLRALQLDPVVLLLDEPTAAIDRQTAAAVEQLLEDWVGDASGGRALVWVTHDPQQARRVAQKILLMENGKIRDASSTA